MPSGTLSGVLRRLRGLIGQPPIDELADDQLLDRFVARHDPAAFTALVERFGPTQVDLYYATLEGDRAAFDAIS